MQNNKLIIYSINEIDYAYLSKASKQELLDAREHLLKFYNEIVADLDGLDVSELLNNRDFEELKEIDFDISVLEKNLGRF